MLQQLQRVGNDEKARSFCEIFAIVQNTYSAVMPKLNNTRQSLKQLRIHMDMTADQLLQFKDIANGLFANLQYVIGGEKLTCRDKESYLVDWIANLYTKYTISSSKNWRILSFSKQKSKTWMI